MRKARAGAPDSAADSLRSIPSVERILSGPRFASLGVEFSRERLKERLTGYLDDLRRNLEPWDEERAAVSISEALQSTLSSTLRKVINATGVIIHTNLGRSPIDAEIWAEAEAMVRGYSNLEFDLANGDRGKRDEHLGAICHALFGSEAAVLTNNNAAGTLLLLAAVAARRQVIVSRGELVEIGGSFRVPEVIQQGGAKLHEVGTTNRTRASDYAEAVTRSTAAILRVHRSNFDIVGFTETPSIEELIEVARYKRVPLLYDEGSGRVVDLAPYGFGRSDTVRELIAKGVDAITCSTDKLIGATQGGLILGSREVIARVRSHPLMRALRAGKESYAVIGATLRAFATGRHEQLVPVYRMLATPVEELRARAEALAGGSRSQVVESRCALGGGTTPTQTIPSIAIAVDGNATELHSRFRSRPLPIVGRIESDVFLLDLRTVLPEELPLLQAALH